MSFYDWYCDLPPSSPQTWGEQTDVPESADWYNSTFIIAWGSNVPQTRTPDAHFFTEVRYKGAKIVAVTPDYAEVSKLADLWLHPKQGTDAALAMAMGHVILKEFHLEQPRRTSRTTRAATPTCRCWCASSSATAATSPTASCARPTSPTGSASPTTRSGRPSPWTRSPAGSSRRPAPSAIAGASRSAATSASGTSRRRTAAGADVKLRLSLLDVRDDVAPVAFPYFGGVAPDSFRANDQGSDIAIRNVPVKRLALADGETLVASVFDLLVANYGIDRGLGGANVARTYEDDVPYTPKWQETITGVKAADVIAVARQFADNAHKTQGKSMVIIGAAMNHWFHSDMNYRSIINMLVLCGCVGKSGGGWSHYVGQEKLRPQTGWTALAFALDWHRPPRQMNSTSFFYAHTDQWRYEKLGVREILSPLADPNDFTGTLIDFNVRAERMGWLPSAPQLQTNPLEVCRAAAAAGMDAKEYAAKALEDGTLRMSCEDPDHPDNFPRNMFVWRSNLLGSSGKGHEYFLNHLLGTSHGLQGKDLGTFGGEKPEEVAWHDEAPDRQARPAGDARLPHVDHLPVLGHRAADRDLVREERPQHLGHAPVHPPAVGGGRPGVGGAQRLGDLQGHREEVLRSRGRPARRREGPRAHAAHARHTRRAGAGRSTCATGSAANASWCPARPRRR